MTKPNYPIKLEENVLVDVVFEIRLDTKNGFSESIPGAAHTLFGEIINIEKLPIADIPRQVRATDENLKYQPTVKMTWDDVVLVIGDHSLGLGYADRYAGWDTFKCQIDKLLKWLENDRYVNSLIKSVVRYSFKYVDFIPDKYYSEIEHPFEIKLELNNKERSNGKLRLDFEVQEDFGVSLFEFATPVAQMDSEGRVINHGTLISIDTVRIPTSPLDLSASFADMSVYKESMHEKNKGFFFDVLSKQLLTKLGARYE